MQYLTLLCVCCSPLLVLSAPSNTTAPVVSVNPDPDCINAIQEEEVKFCCKASNDPSVCMVAEIKFWGATTREEKIAILKEFNGGEIKSFTVPPETSGIVKPTPEPDEKEQKCEELKWDIALIDIALMFFLPLAACFFPYYSKLPMFSCLNVDAYVSWINCMGAGILLGTSFFHLLPEISNEVDTHLKKMHQIELQELEKEKRAEIMRIQQQKLAAEEQAASSRQRRHTHSHSHGDHGHSHGPGGHDDLTFEIYVIVGFFIILISEQFVMTYLMGYFSDMEAKPEPKPEEEALNKGNNHGHGHSHEIEGEASSSTIRAIGFVASLAVHCVVEGAVLTLRTKSWKDNTGMLGSIIFHKIPVGMTMGFLMESSNLKPKTAKIALLVWALFSPIGGVLGFGACKTGWMDSGLIPYLSAIGLGSFLYVLFFEVTPHEFLFKSEQNKFVKALVMMFGAFLSWLVTISFPHTHDH